MDGGGPLPEIGRAAGRGRGEISGGAGSLKKKKRYYSSESTYAKKISRILALKVSCTRTRPSARQITVTEPSASSRTCTTAARGRLVTLHLLGAETRVQVAFHYSTQTQVCSGTVHAVVKQIDELSVMYAFLVSALKIDF